MPTYVPTPGELQQVFDAVKVAGLLDKRGEYLLSHLEILASGKLPPGLAAAALPVMGGNLRSLHLAIALVMTRPSDRWNPVDAHDEFEQIANDLLAAWLATDHAKEQKMRKTVDHVIVFGARQGWRGAREVIYYLILGDPFRFVPGSPPHSPPLARPLPVGGIGASIAYLKSLIPDLDNCWGHPIADDAPVHAAYIQNRFFQPTTVHSLMLGDLIGFSSDPDGVHFNVLFDPVPPGASRTFLLADGSAALIGPRGFDRHVPAGQRLLVRALDEGDAEIQLAHFVPHPEGGAIEGPTCKLHDGEAAQLFAAVESQLEAWSCTCGKWQCDKRHRLEGWDPGTLPPNASLRTFIWTAVKGPRPGFGLKSFITGMYYAVLCDGV